MHKTKSSLTLFAVIAVALLLSIGALFARLWSGPISLSFLTPYLQQALIFDRQDISLRFDDTVLALEGVGDEKAMIPALKIRINNVRVYDNHGVKLLSIPSGAVGLSLSALLHGLIAPSSIEITGPTLHLDWQGENLFADFGGAGPMGDILKDLPVAVEEASAELLPFFIRELLSPPDGGSATGYLRRVRIIDANLILHERASSSDWRLPGSRLEFTRSEQGVLLKASSLLQGGHLQKAGMKNTQISLSGTYGGKGRGTDLKVEFRSLNPAQLAGNSVSMSAFKAVDMALDGVIYVALGADRRIRSAGFDLMSGPGTIGLTKFYQAPLHFDQVMAKGRYDRNLKQFSLESFDLQAGPARFEGDGLIYAGIQSPGIKITGAIKNLPLLALKEYWPHQLASGGYDWVTHNITGGTATSGQLRLNIAPDMGEGSLPEDALDFKFNFTGVKAHYLRPMPPIEAGVGQAKLTTRTFDLTVTDGQVGGLKMGQSHVHFADLHLPEQTRAKIDVQLSGPVSTALKLLDSKPLGYPTEYGLAPESVAGKSDIKLRLEFPLSQSITLKDVQFSVNADLRHLAMPHLFKTVALGEGNLKMRVNRKGLSTKGIIALNQVPFDFTWKEKFGESQKFPTRMTLAGAIAGSQWAALHLPAGAYVKGPALLKVTLRGKGSKILAGQGKIDFGASEIALTRLGWTKAAGAPAALAFKMEKDGERTEFKTMSFKADGLDAKGSLALGRDDSVETAVLKHFKYGATALSAKIARDDAGQYDIAVKANNLDARPLIKKVTESKNDDPDVDLPNFKVNAQIAHVLAENGVEAHQFKAAALYQNNLWSLVRLNGKLKNAKSFSFDLSPSKTGRQLDIASNDAGEVARGFDLFRNAVGGKLAFQGSLTGPVKDQKLKGEVIVKNFKLVQTPVLGKILTIGSLTGIGDLLKGDGITFEQLNIPFTFENGAIALEKSRANGPAIGITMEGGVDLRYDSLTLNGTIIPAYTLNSVLKIMPLVGNLLMGGKGEGLFALTYKVTGPVASPKVDVNPLSVLAPGFLRSIMTSFSGAGTTVSPERKAAEKKAAAEAKKLALPAQP